MNRRANLIKKSGLLAKGYFIIADCVCSYTDLIQKIKCRIPKSRRVRVLLIIALVYIASSPFVSITLPNLKTTYACGSIVFDKWAMNSVDRIDIYTGLKTTTITDKKLIKKIVSETMNAEAVDYNAAWGNTIRLYSKDRLVREMRQGYSDYYICVEVYSPDIKHYNFWYGVRSSGIAVLPQELFDEIEKALEEDGNYYKK